MEPSQSPSNLPEAPSSSPINAPQQPVSGSPTSATTNGMAIAGLVAAFFIPLVGLILSIIGLSQTKKRQQKGSGLAIAGIVLSVIFMAFQLLFFVMFMAGVQEAAKQAKISNTDNPIAQGADFRPDSQEQDVAVKAGEAATIDGVKMTLSNPRYATSLGEYDQAKTGHTYVTADVTIENNSGETRPYNPFDFRIQTAGGQVLDPSFATLPNPLNSGDLLSGGKVSGQIVFEVPEGTGSEYIIWKPSLIDSTRAVIQIR